MTALLIYLSIGSVIWLVMDGLGIIENTFVERGRPSTSRAMVLATVLMIALWPWFVLSWAKGMWSGRI